MKNIFITGSTGFLGFAIIRYLNNLKGTFRIYNLVRKNSIVEHLKPYDLHYVYGDLCQPQSYKKELSLCDTVFHCAGQIGFESRSKDLFHQNNYKGTKALVEAINPEVLKHFVYTSTKGTRSSKKHQPNDENTRFDFTEILDPYLDSKIKAEEFIKSKMDKGFPATIMLPTGLIGWGDIKPTPMGKLIKDFLEQKIPFIPPGGIDLVDVDDVAKAHIEVVRQGKIGESFIISGRFVTFDELFTILFRITGLKKPRLKIPPSVFLMMVFAKEKIDSIMKRTPSVTIKKAKSALSYMESSNAKLIRELGFTPCKVEIAIEKSLKYFQGKSIE
ncbi:NAD-dependent epimerase/dehydratase family protein [bacterium]|nr:NAD-dependent epimerase/dehydratase family protein [bacterium]